MAYPFAASAGYATIIETAEYVELTTPADPSWEGTHVYNLLLHDPPTGFHQRYLLTYVDPHLADVIATCGRKTLYVSCLDPNALAARLLPGRPCFIVTGLEAEGAVLLGGIPNVLRRCRALGIGGGCLGALTSVVLTAVGLPWMGLAMIALCVLVIERFSNIPGDCFPDRLPSYSPSLSGRLWVDG